MAELDQGLNGLGWTFDQGFYATIGQIADPASEPANLMGLAVGGLAKKDALHPSLDPKVFAGLTGCVHTLSGLQAGNFSRYWWA